MSLRKEFEFWDCRSVAAVSLLDGMSQIKNRRNYNYTGFVRLRENLEKGTFEKNHGKPGKLREFSDHFYNLRENSGNFILSNISDQIGGAIRITEASK